MFNLLLGGVIGAIIGSFFERIIKKYIEGVARVQITASYSQKYDTSTFNLDIKNVGYTNLPKYYVILHNPYAGSFRVFNKTTDSEGLPHQVDSFSYDIHGNKNKHFLLQMLTTNMKYGLLPTDPRIELTDEEFNQWSLQLKLKDSDYILFEDFSIGNIIAHKLVHFIKDPDHTDKTYKHVHNHYIYANNSLSKVVQRVLRKTFSYMFFQHVKV